MQNYILILLLNEIIRLKSFFSELTICHIFRERNTEADRLSKEGIEQALGAWTVEEVVDGVARPLAPPIFS